jgi:peptidoglycan/xylan/chitin deacetylase (PgdA/CDA1 family)
MNDSLARTENQLLCSSSEANESRLAIFIYHGVVRSQINWDCFIHDSLFRKQVAYLKNHFEIIPLSHAIERLRNREISRPTAVITLDDGFQNNYDYAFPILREAKVPATFFLVTGFLNTKYTYWYGRLLQALSKTRKTMLKWDGQVFDLSVPASKAKTSIVIAEWLKQFHQSQLLDELRKIILELGEDPESPVEFGSPFRMLDHNSIEKMANSGLIEFGAHTHSHAILSILSEDERRKEVGESIHAINALIENPSHVFAYPNGLDGDYDEDIFSLLESYGIKASVTAIPGLNDETTPLMELRRYPISGRWSMQKFKQVINRITKSDLEYETIRS